MTHPLTIICTSCDRFDLLERTLNSFFELNNYPFVAFHVHNDSTTPIPERLKKLYSGVVTWHEGTKRGLSASWDYLVGLVETEYFFNIEDDWLFDGNPNFIEDSINLLKLYHQVWIRYEKDHSHPLTPYHFEGYKGSQYKIVYANGSWCGFTFNPSVRKLSKWKGWFPNGISGKDEIELSRQLLGEYHAVSLVNSSIRHIGGGRHSNNFKI